MKKNCGLSLLSALLITFSFPPFKFGFLAFIAFIPIFKLLEPLSKREAFRWGYFAGLLTNIMLLYWIGWATLGGATSAILVLPLYFAVFIILLVFSRQKWGNLTLFLAPFWWTSIEWIKTLGQIGFPWFTLGYSQSYSLAFIQFAEYMTVLGVSFWVMLINVLIYFLIQNWRQALHRYKLIIPLGLLLLLPYLHGKWVMPTPEKLSKEKSLRIGLVQGSIDPFKKWKPQFKDSSFTVYTKLSEDVATENPQLIIWPETATPCWLKHEFEYLTQVRNLVDTLNVPLLTGTPDYRYVSETEYRTFNTAILIRPDNRTIPTYEKMRLVPFGERIPYEDSFPFTLIKELLNKLEMGQGNFSPGNEPYVFSFAPNRSDSVPAHLSRFFEEKLHTSTPAADSVRFGVAICYESVFPQIVRNFVNLGADFIVVITNDAWFGKTSMPFQHFQYAVFRAIENRISIARCANAGISGFIDPYGRSIQHTSLFKPAILVDQIPLLTKDTFYVRHGNLFANINLIISSIIFFMMLIFRKKDRKKIPGDSNQPTDETSF